MTVGQSVVFAGGYFTGVGTRKRINIAALNSSGQVTSWNPYADNIVRALQVSSDGDTVYAGGNFSTIGGLSRRHAAALDASTGGATSWDPSVGDPTSMVNSLALSSDDSTLYIAGDFTTIGGQVRKRVAAVATSGSGTVKTLDPNADGTVSVITLSGDGTLIYAGGSFGTIGVAARDSFAAIRATDGLATSWYPEVATSAISAVNAITLSPNGNTVYLGGDFQFILPSGSPANNVVAVSASSGQVNDWLPNPDGPVNAVAVSNDGNSVFLGGAFTSIGGVARNKLAKLSTGDASVSSWNPDAGGDVLSIATSGSSVYAGGVFAMMGVQSNRGFAQFTAAPTNTAAPAITGSGKVSEQLSCSRGSWDDSEASFTYQWIRDGSAINGATSATYTPNESEVGSSIKCKVKAQNIGGLSTAVSGSIEIIIDSSPTQPGTPSTQPESGTDNAPNISGTGISRKCLQSTSLRRLSRNASKSRRPARKPKSSTKIKYTLSEKATVTISIRRRLTSKSLTSCPTKSKRKGETIGIPGSYEEVKTLTGEAEAGENRSRLGLSIKQMRKRIVAASIAPKHRGATGENSTRLSSTGALGSLKPGTYKIYISALDSAGNRSDEAALKFWVLRANLNR